MMEALVGMFLMGLALGVACLLINIVLQILFLGATYLFTDAHLLYWRRPDGLWIITILSFFIYLPLIYINYANDSGPTDALGYMSVIGSFMIGVNLSTIMLFALNKRYFTDIY